MHPQRPPSFASVNGGYPGSELSHYGAQFPHGPPPGAYPYYNMGPPYHAPAAPPPSSASTEATKAAKKEQDSASLELATLREALRKIEDEKAHAERQRQLDEKSRLEILQAEKDAWSKFMAQQEADRVRKEEIAAMEKKIKDAAEADAAEKAKKAKDESDKKLEEATKKHADAETAKKALEEEAKKNKPGPDDDKPPVVFKDVLGRKFNFPWKVCKTWKVRN